jgi:septal ring factor EnvC (AmiA/AmiB activator)
MSEMKKKADKQMDVILTNEAEVPAADNAEDTDTRHIEQIRDIIFGRQMSDYEKRFKKLENKINSQIKELRTYTDASLKAIKKDLQDHHAKFSERLESEKNERGQDNSALSKALDTLSDSQKARPPTIEHSIGGNVQPIFR